MISRSSIPKMRGSWPGRRRSKPCMSKPWSGRNCHLIPACLHASLSMFAWHSNTPSSNNAFNSASRMPTRLLLNTRYVNESNNFYPNSLSLWLCLGFLPTTTLPSAVFVQCRIARKISGGTRSPKGSDTRMGLASLFGTWTAQHLNPFRQCLALLTSPSSLGQL
jgi:hypothetical protein